MAGVDDRRGDRDRAGMPELQRARSSQEGNGSAQKYDEAIKQYEEFIKLNPKS
jgi:hypothetical protein